MYLYFLQQLLSKCVFHSKYKYTTAIAMHRVQYALASVPVFDALSQR